MAHEAQKEEGGGCLQQPKALSCDLHTLWQTVYPPHRAIASTGSLDFKK